MVCECKYKWLKRCQSLEVIKGHRFVNNTYFFYEYYRFFILREDLIPRLNRFASYRFY